MSKARYSNVGTLFLEAYKREQRNILSFEKKHSENSIENSDHDSIVVTVPKKIRFFAWYVDFTHKIWPKSLTQKFLYIIFTPIGIIWGLIGFMPIFIGSYCYKIYHNLGTKKDREYFRQVWHDNIENIKYKLIQKEKGKEKPNQPSEEFDEPDINIPIDESHNIVEPIKEKVQILAEEPKEKALEIPKIPERRFKNGNHKSFSTSPNTSNVNITEPRETRYSFSSSASENKRRHKRVIEAEQLRKARPNPVVIINKANEEQEVIENREIILNESAINLYPVRNEVQEESRDPSEYSEPRTERLSIISSKSKLSNRSKL